MRHIEIWSEVLPQSYWWQPDCFVGGTPEYVVETAECLARKGHDVQVYYDNAPCEHNGVYYLPRSMYKGTDVVLACNSRPPYFGRKNLYWSSRFIDRDEAYLDFDERIVISEYHQSIFGKNSKVISLACWPEKYKNPKKKMRQCLYSSSPDRGADFLHEIWPDVENATGAQLICTYRQDLSSEAMDELYRTSGFWLHPMANNAIELFCISGYKAQAAGCIPVYVPDMALAETIKFGVKTTRETFKDDLIAAIKNPPQCPTIDFLSWGEVTDQLEALF